MTRPRAEIRDELRAAGWRSIQGRTVGATGKRLELWQYGNSSAITLKRAWAQHSSQQNSIVIYCDSSHYPLVAVCVATQHARGLRDGATLEGGQE